MPSDLLRIDPTRTGLLQRRLGVELNRLITRWQVAAVQAVLDEAPTTNAWNDPSGLLGWIKQQAVNLVVKPAKYLLARFLGKGVQVGTTRAVQQARRVPTPPPVVAVQVATALGAPASKDRVALLVARSLNDLQGLTEQTAAGIGRLLIDGFQQGRNPKAVARDIVKQFGLTKQRAETIARTEMIRAHAEGQLIGFETMGVTKLGVKAELRTAGDNRVCPKCHALEGRVYTTAQAKGVIPVHPRCRCAWIPYLPTTLLAKPRTV